MCSLVLHAGISLALLSGFSGCALENQLIIRKMLQTSDSTYSICYACYALSTKDLHFFCLLALSCLFEKEQNTSTT